MFGVRVTRQHYNLELHYGKVLNSYDPKRGTFVNGNDQDMFNILTNEIMCRQISIEWNV